MSLHSPRCGREIAGSRKRERRFVFNPTIPQARAEYACRPSTAAIAGIELIDAIARSAGINLPGTAIRDPSPADTASLPRSRRETQGARFAVRAGKAPANVYTFTHARCGLAPLCELDEVRIRGTITGQLGRTRTIPTAVYPVVAGSAQASRRRGRGLEHRRNGVCGIAFSLAARAASLQYKRVLRR